MRRMNVRRQAVWILLLVSLSTLLCACSLWPLEPPLPPEPQATITEARAYQWGECSWAPPPPQPYCRYRIDVEAANTGSIPIDTISLQARFYNQDEKLAVVTEWEESCITEFLYSPPEPLAPGETCYSHHEFHYPVRVYKIGVPELPVIDHWTIEITAITAADNTQP